MYEDDEDLAARVKKTFERELRERLQLHDVLDTYEGRSTLWRILSQCGLYDAAPLTGDVMRFEGRRDIGLWLLLQIELASSDAVYRMKGEAVERERVAHDV